MKNLFGEINNVADYKTRYTEKNANSFAKKIAKEMIFKKHPDFVGSSGKTSGLARSMAKGAPIQYFQKTNMKDRTGRVISPTL